MIGRDVLGYGTEANMVCWKFWPSRHVKVVTREKTVIQVSTGGQPALTLVVKIAEKTILQQQIITDWLCGTHVGKIGEPYLVFQSPMGSITNVLGITPGLLSDRKS